VGRSGTGDQVRGASEPRHRAREPDESGFIERDGVRVYWESFGQGAQTVLLMPTWAIAYSRIWKFQVPFLARSFRVITFDPRGNGRSDRPTEAHAYDRSQDTADAIAVLDATGVEQAHVVSWCGSGEELMLAAHHPGRVASLVLIAPNVFLSEPLTDGEGSYPFEEPLDSDEGWAKSNRHYWLRDWQGFLTFYYGQIFNEPHSTKQIDDGVEWGMETDPETILRGIDAVWLDQAGEQALSLCGQIKCRTLVVQGSEDAIVGPARGPAVAAAIDDARLMVFEGSGHGPSARDPVKFNLLLSDFLGEGEPRRERRVVRSMDRPHPRALYISSPIGLGHVQRDLAIARELRKLRGDLEIVWLAQHPVTEVLEACGERVHPASKLMANESAHIEAEMGEHELHVFQAWREMDEILLANFMLFHDIVRDERYDLWIGDEAWELDYYLHENPELKTSPYVFMTDFVGWLPIEGTPGTREAFVAADYNAENIAHIERYPGVRDVSLFLGAQADVVPRHFGPGLPFMPDWIAQHFEFSGYVLPFDPAAYRDTDSLRLELGHDSERPLIVASVGGSGVGLHLLRRIAAAFDLLRREVPQARMLLVCGPRIDCAAIEPVKGMTAVGYVHELFRTLACCDLAVVQGGLATTMELVANKRPFISIPLQSHFEQNQHVPHRLARYGAPPPISYADATPERLAAQMLERLGASVEYASVESDGAARAARLIAPLLDAHSGHEARRARERQGPPASLESATP
jgi:pimeloyl-ACP methyl ester carboxylesterase/predicted glycosyltransferase